MSSVASPAPQVLQTFSCEKYLEIGTSFLRTDKRIECWTPTYKAYWLYAIVMIFICEFMISCFFFAPTRKRLALCS